MALFGKKNEEENIDPEFEETSQEEESLEERKLKRKLRDLQKENRKKRKEPTKPWGKKERFLVLAILILTLLIAGLLALYARGVRIPSIDFGPLNIFQEKTIIIN